MDLIFGTLILHAERQVPPIELEELRGFPVRSGQHVTGRYNGRWTEVTTPPPIEIYLPQRYKNMTLTTTHENAKELVTALEDLDTQYGDARQLFKLNKILDRTHEEFAAVVNVAAVVQAGRPVSGSFYLLSNKVPLYFALVFDIEENSVQLVWSTLDFKLLMQSRAMLRYIFYPFPPIVNRPVFLPTQSLCARWWKFVKGFGEERHGLMKAANALELYLFKDPTVEHGRKGE